MKSIDARMESYQRLVAGLPERTPHGGSRCAGARVVRARAAALPLADPVRAVGEAAELLDGVLGHDVPDGGRLDALEQLEAPVGQLCAAIERGIERQRRRPVGVNADCAVAARNLQWRLASGYAWALHELCTPAGKVPRFKTRRAVLAAVRGLDHAECALAWAYRGYGDPAPDVLRCAHALHAFAVESGIADQPAIDAGEGTAVSTPRAAYARLLLLAMSDPYRFDPAELRDVRRVIACVADRCRLVPAEEGYISFDPSGDAGPTRVARPGSRTGTRLALEVSGARKFLDEQVAWLADGADTVDLVQPEGDHACVRLPLLERLQAGWQPVRRGCTRLDAGHALDLVVGMSGLHFALAGNLAFPAFVRRVLGDTMPASRDEAIPAWLVATDDGQPDVLRAEVVDQGGGGYRVRLPARDGLVARVGELVGLAPVDDDEDARDWMVGVIRWMRETTDVLVLGLELLRRRARAAGMRPLTATGEELPPVRALELHGAHDGGVLSLLMNHRLARGVDSVGVVLSAFASDWTSAPTAAMYRPRGIQAIAPGCFGVTLERDDVGPVDAAREVG